MRLLLVAWLWVVGCSRTVSLGSDRLDDAAPLDAPAVDGTTPQDAGPVPVFDVGTPRDVMDVPDVPDIGDAADVVQMETPPIPQGTVTSIVAGAGHTCATRSDGSCWCWGDNRRGQLGDGTTASRTEPVLVAGLPPVLALALGAEHTCALAGTPARLWCWGRGDDGRLFVPSMGDALRPTDTGLAATRLAAGGATTCVLQSGRVRCAGRNDEGQRGADPGVDLAITGTVTSLVMGEAFGCALAEGGSVWCWGRNVEGEAGRGDTSPAAPVGRVMGPLVSASVRAITAGGRHVCARGTTQTWCWGDRTHGQLGDGMTGGSVSTPALSPWGDRTLVAGRDFTCGIFSQSVQCAGANDRGQLGTPGPGRASPSLAVANFARVGTVFLTAGAAHACAYLSDAQVWCWGDGSLGQRGDGTRDVIDMPRMVSW